jgi:hypothetical protein
MKEDGHHPAWLMMIVVGSEIATTGQGVVLHYRFGANGTNGGLTVDW